MHVGELIKQSRLDHNLSMQDFADKSSLSKAYVAMLERVYNPENKQPISPAMDKMNKIAKGMGLSFDDLLQRLNSGSEFVDSKDRAVEIELNECLEELRNNPEMRQLLKSARNISKESIQKTCEYINFLKFIDTKDGKK